MTQLPTPIAQAVEVASKMPANRHDVYPWLLALLVMFGPQLTGSWTAMRDDVAAMKRDVRQLIYSDQQIRAALKLPPMMELGAARADSYTPDYGSPQETPDQTAEPRNVFHVSKAFGSAPGGLFDASSSRRDARDSPPEPSIPPAEPGPIRASPGGRPDEEGKKVRLDDRSVRSTKAD